MRSLAPSRSGSYASTSSTATTPLPPIATTGSRKSSLTTPTPITPLSATDEDEPATPRHGAGAEGEDDEEDDDGFVTADEDVEERDFAKQPATRAEGVKSAPKMDGPATTTMQSGLRGLMGRLKL